ncbi:hypothetical protein FJ250_13100 [bacterium]|nr:hypothetical protein [bacterium]
MKKLALALALTLVALAGTASAADWFANNVGIYFDEAATSNCGTVAPMTPFAGYLVFTQMTAADINAWEIQLNYNNVTKLSFMPRGVHVMISPRPGEAMVGLATPAPVVGGSFVAADLQLVVLNPNPAGIFANGVFFHLLDIQVPAYTNSQDVAYELHPISPPGSPIMTINNGCAIDVEVDSFGAVKSLFR